jgi:hypothetical protein
MPRPSCGYLAGVVLAGVAAACGSRAGLDTSPSTSDSGAHATEDGGSLVGSVLDAGGLASPDDAATSDSGAPLPMQNDASSAVVAYTSCAQGLSDPDNNVFLNASGIESGATLTLVQSGQAVTATYVDFNGLVRSLAFAPTTSTSATLVGPAGQTLSGFSAMCVMGPGDESFYPVVMGTTAGTLTYDRGVAFVAVEGVLQGDGGPCGAPSTPASFWVLCGEGDGGAPPLDPGDAAVPSAPLLPVGTYTCSSEVDTYDAIDGLHEYVTGGGNGTLTLTQSGSEATAQYSGDSAVAGTMLLTVTTAATANARASQSLMAPCAVPVGMGGGAPPTPAPLTLASGSIAVTGSTLLLSFAGSMGASSSCPGAVVAGSLICAKP